MDSIVYERSKKVEQQFDLLLKQKLEETEQPDLFWETMIEFIETSLKQYAVRLREKGIDPSIFAFSSKQNNEDSIKEKLSQIKTLLVSLSRLNRSLDTAVHKNNLESNRKINALESELNDKSKILAIKEHELINTQREIEQLKADFLVFKQENEKKLLLQPKQIKTKLNQDLKLVRDRVNMIHDMVLQTDKDSVETLHGHVNDAIQTIVHQLAEKELWPEEEKKPEFNSVKKEVKPATKRSRRKKSESNNSDKDVAMEQVKLNLEPQNEKPVELEESQEANENEALTVDINQGMDPTNKENDADSPRDIEHALEAKKNIVEHKG